LDDLKVKLALEVNTMKKIVQSTDEQAQRKLDRMSDRLQAALQTGSERADEL
jgi:hypothetical protein